MKKIVPFNNVLTFNTDVCEITSISLEHDIKKEPDSISGAFYISGEYKITDGQVEKEKFNFELPFDIALGEDYDLNTLVIDIDDFRYELIDNRKLKVNIELYLDGEIKEPSQEEITTKDEILEKVEIQSLDNPEEMLRNKEEHNEDKNTLLDEMLKEKNTSENEITIENNNINDNINDNSIEEQTNIFNNFAEKDEFVTYRVYRLNDGDTIDKIIEKYNITKEELSKYNNIEDIHPGDKLIIPANDK